MIFQPTHAGVKTAKSSPVGPHIEENKGGGSNAVKWDGETKRLKQDSPLKKVAGSSAGVGAMYPPFGGYSQSIPQCVILNVYPLVKSSFWETKLSPNDFFNFDPSDPLYLGTAFWHGASGGGGGGRDLLERGGGGGEGVQGRGGGGRGGGPPPLGTYTFHQEQKIIGQ